MFTRSSWPPVLRDQIVRREDQLSVPRRTHNNEPAIGRPRYTCQRTKISSIAIYQSKSPQSTAEIRQGHKENTHCSANASMTRRQPSSEIAATYLTSGEKTKSIKKIKHISQPDLSIKAHRRHSASTLSSGSLDFWWPCPCRLSHPPRRHLSN